MLIRSILYPLTLLLITTRSFAQAPEVDLTTIISADGRSVDVYASNPHAKPVNCRRVTSTATFHNVDGAFLAHMNLVHGSFKLSERSELASTMPLPSSALALFSSYPGARITALTPAEADCTYTEINHTPGPLVAVDQLCQPDKPERGYKGRDCPLMGKLYPKAFEGRCGQDALVNGGEISISGAGFQRLVWAGKCGYIPGHVQGHYYLDPMMVGSGLRKKALYLSFAWLDPSRGYTVWKPELEHGQVWNANCTKPLDVIWVATCEEK